MIDQGLVNNESDENETIHRFLEIYERSETVPDTLVCNAFDDSEDTVNKDTFETRAVFTLADYLKSLGPEEYFDIAQKVFNFWEQ